MWRPWQLKSFELFHAVATSGPLCQQLTQEYRLVCIQAGAAHHRYRNTRDQVANGAFYVIEPGETLGYQPKDSTFYCLFIDPAWLQQFATEQLQREQLLPHFSSRPLFDPSVSQAMHDLAARSLTPASRLQQEETLLHLFAPLLVRHAEDAGTLPRFGNEHPAVKLTKEYLQEHYAEEVALQELARVVNMSPFHLSHIFHQAVGLPPHAYQTRLRLARAKTLLTQGYYVGYVAHETGFFDQSHFSEQFKRHYQVTPGNYRKTTRFSLSVSLP
ncbi:AraC family transcriptional regulator [Ktedonosporobacter rubrisoli]|uniref:AraC family transcriptional regulator n=1 Tax=Ktedonosporobacter rubrisoli TaxID=2509675 RepID=A0A4P6JQC8_KTERU|nr:AraC family transcriptional regulator [Ktedonosporobacter rubrisoli]QBD77618.1 AraC family transcriptional regulator [Ktedonosporobacter rubrisoli]